MKLNKLLRKMPLTLSSVVNGRKRFRTVSTCLLLVVTLPCFVYIYNSVFSFTKIDSLPLSEDRSTSLVVLVLSKRHAFSRREAIRRTWATEYKHVYFVVSELYCQYPTKHRINGTCNPNNTPATKEQIQYNIDKEEETTKRLRNESNVVLFPIIDVFEELPNLIKESYTWAIRNHNPSWFLHVDDSFNVQVDAVENHLATNFDSDENIVMMLMIQCTATMNQADISSFLTPFHCSLNHVVSKQVAQYLVDGLSEIFEYKDTTNSSSIQVLDSPHIKSVHREELGMMTLNGGCSNTGALVLDICIEYKMNMCVDGKTYSISENPSEYLHSDRFDLIVKMVYAYFYVYENKVPHVIKDAYLEHIRVWNNFKESCNMEKIWFDSKIKCEKKESGSDFISSFHNTIKTVKQYGFNPNMSRIPVDKYGFINNGAHRLSSSIVLLRNASFEHHTYARNSGWGYKHFKRLGLSEKSFDLVMLEWMKIQLKLPNLKTSVYIVSVFSNDKRKDEAMRTLVKERCSKDNGILYEKSINVTRQGAKQLISHMYGQQSWLKIKTQQMLSRFTGASYTVRFLFVYTKRSTDLVKCKYEIRKLYNDKIFKSTAHIPDTLEENLVLAEMILNPNSIQFLNHAGDAADCKNVAKEVAARSSISPIKTLPGIYVGRDDVMLDSGTVLGIFDLRRRTDVDLLFLHDIDPSILGNHNGITIQAHAFQYNSISRERAWGEDHFSDTGTRNQWDLFYDPQNYGYCYGVKFVSLKQLVRYKIKRNEPKKDSYDVELINTFLETIPNKCPNQFGNPSS